MLPRDAGAGADDRSVAASRSPFSSPGSRSRRAFVTSAPIAGRRSWHHISLNTLWRCHG
jgi:hypothetical protein